MTKRLNAFVESHPAGWNHDEWLGLLADLDESGADVSDPDAIGLELERTRLSWELRRRGVQGLGPKKVKALADRFGSLYELHHASIEDLVSIPGMNRALAEKVLNGSANGHG